MTRTPTAAPDAPTPPPWADVLAWPDVRDVPASALRDLTPAEEVRFLACADAAAAMRRDAAAARGLPRPRPRLQLVRDDGTADVRAALGVLRWAAETGAAVADAGGDGARLRVVPGVAPIPDAVRAALARPRVRTRVLFSMECGTHQWPTLPPAAAAWLSLALAVLPDDDLRADVAQRATARLNGGDTAGALTCVRDALVNANDFG